MRLISCYVENFGCLHQFSMEFTDGLNCIRKPNGWGKTTFAVFIKAMLFGLEYSPRKKLEENERKKYMPWQGGAFGGNLVFEAGKKRYRAERFFGVKDKEDTFCLYDADTGLVSEDFSERLGEELFHIDSASYEKSTYIPQNSTQAEVTDHLSARLGNIIENANDMERSTEAIRFLTERQKEYKRTGKRGKIYEMQRRISDLEHGIAECEGKEQAVQNLEAKISREQIRRDELLREKEQLELQIAGEMKRREWQMSRDMKRQLEQQLQQNQNGQAQLQRSWNRETAELEAGKAQLQKQREALSRLQRSYEGHSQKTQGHTERKGSLQKVAGVALIAAGIAIQVFAANRSRQEYLFFMSLIAIVCAVTGVILLIRSFRREAMKKQVRHRCTEDISAYEIQIAGMKEECGRLETGIRKRRRYMEELQQEIRISRDAQAELQRKLALLKTEEEERDTRIPEYTGQSLEQMQEQSRKLDESIRSFDRNIVEYRRDAEACMTILDGRQDLEAELAVCREQKARMEENYDILQQTVTWLQKAKEQFASYYMGPLAKGFQKYAAIICGEEADETERMQMDISLEVRMETNGVLREKAYFSAGYRDFIGVCTRLALTDALFKEETPFLILDDPFVNLDDEKMKRAGKLLRELADTFQVIYLVCHSSRS